MKYLLIILCLFIANCSPLGTPVEVDEELLPFISLYAKYKFEYTGSTYAGGISAGFGNLEAPKVGVCVYSANGGIRIIIDYDFWLSSRATDTAKEIIIFHELGHCDLDHDHFEADSIMEPSMINETLYLNNKDYFLRQLFTGSTPVKK